MCTYYTYSWNKKIHARNLEIWIIGCQFVAEVHCYLNSITGLGQTAFIWGSAKFKDMFLLSLDL